MDTREQKIRDRISALESEIQAKQVELRRLTDALDVWLEVDGSDSRSSTVRTTSRTHIDPPTNVANRFSGKKFIPAIYAILSERGPQSTGEIYDALVAGGFESDAKNFRSVVSNMLNEAAKHKRLIKSGKRKDAKWSAPPVLLRFGSGE